MALSANGSALPIVVLSEVSYLTDGRCQLNNCHALQAVSQNTLCFFDLPIAEFTYWSPEAVGAFNPLPCLTIRFIVTNCGV